MTEVDLAKLLRKSNYTCEGVNCDECKKTNYLHACLMADVQLYCDDILGADDNYIEKLEKENAELKAHCKAVDEVNVKLKCCGNCINRGLNKDDISYPCCDCKHWRKNKSNDYWEMEK